MTRGYAAPATTKRAEHHGSQVFTGSFRAVTTARDIASDSLALRPIGPDDIDPILAINIANVPEVGDVDRDRMEHLVAESAIAVVAEVGGVVAGFSITFAPGADYDSINYRWFGERYPAAMYLDRVAFADEHRGRGFGTIMYGEVERQIRERFPDSDGWTLEVNVDPPNEASLAFHRRLGFVEVGRQPFHGIEVSLMHRPLV